MSVKESEEKSYWDSVDNAGEVRRNPLHPVVRYFARQRMNHAGKFIDWRSIDTALDVACGTGFSSCHCPPGISLIGVDFSHRLLKMSPNTTVQASAYRLPFASNSFDLVYGWDFLHHLDEPSVAISEMVRVSKKYIMFFEPNRNNPVQFLYALSNRNERGTLHYDKNAMIRHAKRQNLNILSCRTAGWIFAGATPQAALGVLSRLPFVHSMGISVAMLCEKP